MASVVPQPDYWLRQIVFIAQCTKTRCAKDEVPADCSLEPEPAGGEYPQEVATGKKQHVILDCAYTFDGAVCPRADLAR
jgi:hypothetical protein